MDRQPVGAKKNIPSIFFKKHGDKEASQNAKPIHVCFVLEINLTKTTLRKTTKQ